MSTGKDSAQPTESELAQLLARRLRRWRSEISIYRAIHIFLAVIAVGAPIVSQIPETDSKLHAWAPWVIAIGAIAAALMGIVDLRGLSDRTGAAWRQVEYALMLYWAHEMPIHEVIAIAKSADESIGGMQGPEKPQLSEEKTADRAPTGATPSKRTSSAGN